MIDLDYVIDQETDLDDVLWHEIGEAPFRHDCFLGDIRFLVDGVDFSAEWGWIPVFDFALGMNVVAGSLAAGRGDEFEFVDSSLSIAFLPKGAHVMISSNYVAETAVTSIDQFQRAAQNMLERVRSEIETRHPSLRRNPHYRRILESYQ